MLLYVTDGDEPSTLQEPGTVGSQSDAAPTFDLSGWHACSGWDQQTSKIQDVIGLAGSGCILAADR